PTDYVDLFQLHKPPPALLRSSDILTPLEALRRAGKIRYFGIACDTVEDALLCLKLPGIASIQITINLLDQKALSELLPRARDQGLGVIARNPRAQGHLTNDLSDITAETYARSQQEVEMSKTAAQAFLLLTDTNRTLVQAAIQFVRQLDGVSVLIPRAISRRQLDEILTAQNLPEFSEQQLHAIDRISRESLSHPPRHRYRATAP
ncbi:MAG: aldo/keto reductase, partial [Pseudomonadota bacterium]